MKPSQPVPALPFLSAFAMAGALGCSFGGSGSVDPGEGGGPDAGADATPDATPTPDAGRSEPDAGPKGPPTISMQNLVAQSQVEPFRGDQPPLAGDFAVKQVQKALVDEGFEVSVDGWFGNETAEAYSGWQESLGYSGLAANGIPGPASLAELGEGRFEIRHEVEIGPRTTLSGSTVNQRTHDMVVEADSMLDHGIVLTQGSYNAGGVDASAGTHDGGGAVDVRVKNLTTTQRWQTVEAMRSVGFAAWLRTPDQGPWPVHIHAIAVDDTDLSIAARNQVADYYVGKNGLASHAPDNTPSDYRVPFTWWERYLRNR